MTRNNKAHLLTAAVLFLFATLITIIIFFHNLAWFYLGLVVTAAVYIVLYEFIEDQLQ